MTLEPEIAFDRKNSFIGWGFEGHNLGNIIRYSPNAFLDDNADTTEIKIQYMMMRTGADYEIVSGRFSDFFVWFGLDSSESDPEPSTGRWSLKSLDRIRPTRA